MKALCNIIAATLVSFVSVAAAQPVDVHTQGFNSSISPWGEQDVSGTGGDWDVATSGTHPSPNQTTYPHEGSRFAWFNSYYQDAGRATRIYSPDLDLSSADVAECRFWQHRDTEYPQYPDDRIKFQVSTNGGSSYTTLAVFYRYSDTAWGWEEKVVPLGYYTGETNLRISILGISGYGNNIYIDHLTVTKETLTASSEGADCTVGTECSSGICGVDPWGNGRCREAGTDCIDGNRMPVSIGTSLCHGTQIVTCVDVDMWAVEECTTGCGPYQGTCSTGECYDCIQLCDSFTDAGCASDAYCQAEICYYKKADGEVCSQNKHCLSNTCVASPEGTKYCEPAGTPCADNAGGPVADQTTLCYQNNVWTCLAGSGWSSADCYKNCGVYVDVDECIGGVCTACATSCIGPEDCKPGIPCESNQCAGELPNGSTCLNPAQCVSNHCVDGHCCATACAGTCQRCDTSGDGTCTPVPNGQDPDDDCSGEGLCDGSCDGSYNCSYPGQSTSCDTCARCNGIGFCSDFVPAGTDPDEECGICKACDGSAPGCVLIAAGQDPLNDCAQEPQSTCGRDGECNGSGACRKWAAGTVCVPGSCLNGVVTLPDTCDGNGICVNNGSENCDPYRCNGDVCYTSCNQHAHCITSTYCSAGQTCDPDLIDGADCENRVYPGQEDDAACVGGNCLADNFDGSGAWCSAVDNICFHDGTSYQVDYELCSGNDFYKTCIGGAWGWSAAVGCEPGPCDGGGGPNSGYRPAGTCISAPNGGCSATCESCEPYLADAGGCLTTCTSASQCWSGYICSSNECQVPQGIGDPCTTQSDCIEGTCVDNFCCNTPCSGPCRICNVPGNEGICTMAAAGTDPEDDCPSMPASSCSTTGVCGTAGNCQLWATGTECAPAYCDGPILHAKSTCDGTGSCMPGTETDCRPNRCVGTTCLDGCDSHSDCDTAAFCGTAGECLYDLADGADCANVVYSGLDDDPACAGQFCFDDNFNQVGAYCASSPSACVAAGQAYQAGYRLCRNDEWYRTCVGGELGWGDQVACRPADICDAGGGPGSGAREAETCTDGLSGGCASQCISCLPYMAASPGVCATSCVEDAGCWAGYYCQGGVCLKRTGLGNPCTSTEQCEAALYCVDGVCCNTTCSAVCQYCNNPQNLGICLFVQEGTDPTDDCPEEPPCGKSGSCNGAGSCSTWPASTECAPSSCSDGILTLPSRCDDKGECIPGATEACPTGTCDGDQCAGEIPDGGTPDADGGVPDGGQPDGDQGAVDGGDPGNRPPVAEAGPHQTVNLYMEVTLDGSKSSDPEGAFLQFEWKQTSGPAETELLGSTTATPRFAAVYAGVYVFELKVHDGVQYSDPDYTEVNVIAGSDSNGCACTSSDGYGSHALFLLLACLLVGGLRKRRH